MSAEATYDVPPCVDVYFKEMQRLRAALRFIAQESNDPCIINTATDALERRES